MGPVDEFHPVGEAEMPLIVHPEVKTDGKINSYLIMPDIFGCMEKRQWTLTFSLQILCDSPNSWANRPGEPAIFLTLFCRKGAKDQKITLGLGGPLNRISGCIYE